MPEEFAAILDWSSAGDCWIVDEGQSGRLRGAMQVCFGKPTARLENLSTDPHLDGRTRARVVRDLNEAALALCKQLGASAVRSFVTFKDKSIKKNMKRQGWSVTGQGNVLLRVL